jgi:HEAT repeat protein
MRFVILFFCLGFTAAAPSSASAQTAEPRPDTDLTPALTNAPTADQLTHALSHFERTATAEELRSLGPNTLQRLMQLYQATNSPGYVKLRALGALRHFPAPATRSFLVAVLEVPGQVDLHKRHALLSLAHAFGATARDEIRPYLNDPEPVVREAAGRALAHLGDTLSLRDIAQRVSQENNRYVRETLESLLNR